MYLQTFQGLLVVARLRGIRVTIKDSIFLTPQKFLLESFSVDHRRAKVKTFRLETSRGLVTMSCTNLKVDGLEPTPLKTLNGFRSSLSLESCTIGKLLFLTASSVFDVCSHVVETGRSSLELDMCRVEILTCWNICELILDDSEHLSHSIENATGKFVLVVDCKPATQHLRDVWFENLRARQLN